MDTESLGPDSIEWLGTQYRTLIDQGTSGGAISVTDSISPPNSGPPRHIHHDADETFVVLTGEIGFWLDGETEVCGPGGSVFIPRGTPHTFTVLSDVPSRHLVILTPGGFEGFFAEMAEGQFKIPDDMARIGESAERFKMNFCGPPLSPDDFDR
ncbi:cupin domain-containing protein [Roseobacter sp.]|uniref:cupin domain-containing protein n=1 Tax=Roseobacter sp. TaxID=1907202 RepID=UPI0025FEF994|nr:cupin domain-containing protein [Roseobacter sp.]